VGAPHSVLDAGARLMGSRWPKGVFAYADFDSLVFLRRLSCPVLVIYGAGDISMPAVQGAQRVLADSGGPVAVRYYAGADHGLRRGDDKHVSRQFLGDLSGWLRSDSMEPQVAGVAPGQPFAAVPPPTGGAVAAQGYWGAAALLALAGAGWGEGASRAGVRLPLTLARAGAVATVLAHLRYLTVLVRLATNYRTDPLVVRLGYRLVQTLGIATVVAGGVVALRVRRSRSRAALASAAAGLGGAATLLSLAARWGAFGPWRREH
jgi:hypothetical protein